MLRQGRTILNNNDPIYILAGWLIDGTGGPALSGAMLKVSEGTIVSIGKAESCKLDQNNIIDFSHCTLLPGFVDSHVHLAMSGTNNMQVRHRQLIAPFNEVKALILRHLTEQLNHGVVALRDGGDHTGHTLHYIKECQLQEAMPVTVMTAGKAWHADGRYGKLFGRTPFIGQSLAQSIFRDHDGIDHIKIVHSGLNSLSDYGRETPPQFDPEQLSEAVKTANDIGLRTMVHANGREAVRSAIEAGCHSIEHGFFMGDENMIRMAQKGITWVPTLFTMEAYSRISRAGSTEAEVAKKNLDHQIDQVSRAAGFGVNIATGTDSGSPDVHHGQAISEEMRLLISAGLSLESAIKCATLNGARLLDIEDRVGKLTPGMPTTFVAAMGGPENLPDSLKSLKAVWVQEMAWDILPSSKEVKMIN
ncbi:amidohydrolase family protein [Thermodesulfobacteriota bacterium]